MVRTSLSVASSGVVQDSHAVRFHLENDFDTSTTRMGMRTASAISQSATVSRVVLSTRASGAR